MSSVGIKISSLPDFLPASMLAGQTLYRHTLPQQGKIALLGLTERASFDMLFDIEQALVMGAHGARQATVLLV